MRYGDILLAVDGFPTASWDDFLRARARCGAAFVARVFREGAEFDVPLTLRPSSTSPLEVLAELQTRGILPRSAGTASSGDQ